jgi:plastocyanin
MRRTLVLLGARPATPPGAGGTIEKETGLGRKWGGRCLLVLGAGLLAAACGSAGSGSGDAAEVRTVQVDYSSDEAATTLLDYFPRRVVVRPGDTVEFKQAWTGEPHSVTMGTFVEEKLRPVIDLAQRVEREGKIPEGEPEEFAAFDEALPYSRGGDEETGGMSQNAAQPCYVDQADFDGTYPGDAKTPCPNRVQPEFNGRQAIYNSGVIPYEGVKGNTFTMKLADDLAPGTYSFYCNWHGPLQYGQLEVREKGAKIPSRAEVARQARKEAEATTSVMLASLKAARGGKVVTGGFEDEPITVDAGKTNLIGVPTPFFADSRIIFGVLNEFVPERVETRVGQRTTWTFGGYHTISFNVPKYFPIFTVEPDGAYRFNPQASDPVGWTHLPRPPEGPPEESQGPPQPLDLDAGPWDGQGFHSTGVYGPPDTFSITFTRPGTYTYACLLHPQMVGRVVVKP